MDDKNKLSFLQKQESAVSLFFLDSHFCGTEILAKDVNFIMTFNIVNPIYF